MTLGVVVELHTMQRILSMLIALGLASLAPLPVSACALLHSHTSECASPQTKVDCGHMAMEQEQEPLITVSNRNKTCCGISQAPLPEQQTWGGSFAVAAPPAPASSVVAAATPLVSARSSDIARYTSPPPLQSLLCTYLI
jgi:hypothetical protein